MCPGGGRHGVSTRGKLLPTGLWLHLQHSASIREHGPSSHSTRATAYCLLAHLTLRQFWGHGVRNLEASIAVAVEVAPYMATALRLRYGTHTHAGQGMGHLTGLDHHPAAHTAKAQE